MRWMLPMLSIGCVQVDVTAPEVCLSAADVEMPAPPDLSEISDAPIELSTEVVQDELSELPDQISAEVLFEGGLLAAVEGNLDFVDTAKVTLSSPSGELPDVSLFSFDRSVQAADADVPILGAGDIIDLAAYLANGGAAFGFELTGNAAEVPERVVFDADLCMSGVLSYEHRFIDL